MPVKIKEQNPMPINQDYYERYTALCSEVWRAWHAVIVFNTLIDLADGRDLKSDDNRRPIYNYLLDTSVRDAALTLWKVFYDADGKANTIEHLNSAMRTEWGFTKSIKLSLSKKAKIDKSQLKDIRDKYLAHREKSQFDFRFTLDPLRAAYEEMVDMLNGLCSPEIDERVKPISKAEMFSTQTSIKKGLKRMTKGLFTDKKQLSNIERKTHHYKKDN